MTLPKLSSLTPEQIRVIIAEVCGWVEKTYPNSRFSCGSHGCAHDEHIEWVHSGCRFSPMLHKGETSNVPNYLSDLNAMHEAEKVLSLDQQARYTASIKEICKRDGLPGGWAVDSIGILNWYWHATATQRAHAFLLATGKAQP